MLLLLTFAVVATYEVFRTGQFRLKVVNPTYRQLVLSSLLHVGIILTILLIACWLLNTPTATSIS
jgi:hypothetical protein